MVGNIDVIRKFSTAEVDCEVMTPSKDYIVTEVFMTSRPSSGITFVQLTFSEDFGIHEDTTRQESFEIGQVIAAWDNEYHFVNNF